MFEGNQWKTEGDIKTIDLHCEINTSTGKCMFSPLSNPDMQQSYDSIEEAGDGFSELLQEGNSTS